MLDKKTGVFDSYKAIDSPVRLPQTPKRSDLRTTRSK